MDKTTAGVVGGEAREHESWLRRHALVIGVALIGTLAFAMFTWGEWGYFRDQCSNLNTVLTGVHAHAQTCPSFWSREHIHDWSYNAASNWQSEMLFGILLLVVLLKLEGPEGADRDDT